jgi:GTP-binding protein
MRPLFDAVLKHVPVRDDNPDGPLQFQISSIDYNSYVGKIGIGRVNRGRVKPGMEVICMNGPEGVPFKGA